MSVNLEVKGQLAKLLATENLIVEHRNVETAQFDVQKRVLTLPNWKRASNQVFDLLVAHEVGHALFTPNEDWTAKNKIPMQFLNVTEDVRVEKLMKRKFGGLRKTFYKGYGQLAEKDFFSIADDDISQYNLADRVNLHFKIGNFVDVPIAEGEESDILNAIENAETFEDAIDAAKLLYNYCKKAKEDKKEDQQNPTNQNSASSQIDGEPQNNNTSSSGEGSEEGESEDQSSPEPVNDHNQSPSGADPGQSDEIEVKTQSELDEQLKDLVGHSHAENKYIEIPKVDAEELIYSYKEVLKDLDQHFACFSEEAFHTADTEYRDFCKSSAKEVNYLVKEFECRKSAAAYARATTSRTGVLDTGKLHTYKFNEDLFKKVTVIPDGKNHGLVFVLDWSGSMGEVILDTVKQLLNLISFCRKVKIPFELYSFISHFSDGKEWDTHTIVPMEENKVTIFRDFRMLNLVSSRGNAKEIDKQTLNLWRMAYQYRHYVEYTNPPIYSLGGTPLNQAIAAMHSIIPYFKKMTGVEKVNTIILTDGESAPLKFNVVIPRSQYYAEYNGVNTVDERCYLRNRKTGHVTQMGTYSQQTSNLVKDLSQTFSDVNIIGIRLVSGRDFYNFQRDWVSFEERERISKQWKKDKSVVLKQVGFDAFFAIACNSLNNSVEFDVEESATKTQIRNAFKKSLSSKALNKKILTEFISIIA